MFIKPQLKTFSPPNRKINISNNYLAYTMMGIGVCTRVYVCESFKAGGTSTRNQNTGYKLKSKILHNAIFSFDTSKDTPPSTVRIMNSQVLN